MRGYCQKTTAEGIRSGTLQSRELPPLQGIGPSAEYKEPKLCSTIAPNQPPRSGVIPMIWGTRLGLRNSRGWCIQQKFSSMANYNSVLWIWCSEQARKSIIAQRVTKTTIFLQTLVKIMLLFCLYLGKNTKYFKSHMETLLSQFCGQGVDCCGCCPTVVVAAATSSSKVVPRVEVSCGVYVFDWCYSYHRRKLNTYYSRTQTKNFYLFLKVHLSVNPC